MIVDLKLTYVASHWKFQVNLSETEEIIIKVALFKLSEICRKKKCIRHLTTTRIIIEFEKTLPCNYFIIFKGICT
jgi:hypothetical protein